MFPDVDEEMLKIDPKEVMFNQIKGMINEIFEFGLEIDLATVIFSLKWQMKEMEKRKKEYGY